MNPETNLPPHDLDAEAAVLGCLLLDARTVDGVLPTIPPEAFYATGHRLIFESVLRLHQAGTGVDVLTVADNLQARGQLEQAGGPEAITRALETVQHTGHAKHYAETVREKWQKRQLRATLTETLLAIHTGTDAAAELAARCESRLHSIISTGADREPVGMAAVAAQWEAARGAGQAPALSTGWPDVDKLTRGGLRGGQQVILAARPGMGKTSLALSAARNVARQGGAVLFCSLEMPRHELASRLLSMESGIEAAGIDSGELSAEDGRSLAGAIGRVSKWPLVLDDSPARTVAEISAFARLQKRRSGLELLVVDYLQLLTPEDRRAPREQQVATMSRGLKSLALDLQIPVLCLSQLNRAVETRENRQPRLSDLRESGAIEQDADLVLFIHRESVHDHKADETEARLIVAKHRNGPTGAASLHWHGATMQFRNAAPAYVALSAQDAAADWG